MNRRTLGALLMAPLLACAPPTTVRSPQEIRALQAAHEDAPSDGEITLALAEADYASGELDAALPLLATIRAADSTDDEAALFEAFTLDGLQRDSAAVTAYRRLRARSASGVVRAALDSRLTLLAYRARVATARAVAARGTPSASPSAVLVLPFYDVAKRGAYVPLGVGLATLLADDLTRARLDVVPGAEGRMVRRFAGLETDTSREAARRVAALLGAGTVIRGVLDTSGRPGVLRLRAAAIRVSTGELIDTASALTLPANAATIETAFATQFSEALGGTVPPHLGEDALHRRRNPLGLDRYGSGLDALDRGRFDEASRLLTSVANMNSVWQLPRAAAAEAALLVRGATASPSSLAARVRGPTMRRLLRARLEVAVTGVAPTLMTATGMGVEEAVRRKPLAEATGVKGPERSGHTATVSVQVH